MKEGLHFIFFFSINLPLLRHMVMVHLIEPAPPHADRANEIVVVVVVPEEFCDRQQCMSRKGIDSSKNQSF